MPSASSSPKNGFSRSIGFLIGKAGVLGAGASFGAPGPVELPMPLRLSTSARNFLISSFLFMTKYSVASISDCICFSTFISRSISVLAMFKNSLMVSTSVSSDHRCCSRARHWLTSISYPARVARTWASVASAGSGGAGVGVESIVGLNAVKELAAVAAVAGAENAPGSGAENAPRSGAGMEGRVVLRGTELLPPVESGDVYPVVLQSKALLMYVGADPCVLVVVPVPLVEKLLVYVTGGT
mmetsp:Transcript_56130/g.99890  ORF Transcript_56130/g.99890 Transcript_56130/m.99890 type:complete len:241 (+) Transcript_56130:757-1479(+)